MTGAIFIVLLAICSLVTGLVVQVEKMLAKDFPTNVIALATGIVVGIAVTYVYYSMNGIGYTNINIMYWILIACSSGVGAMIGYDKVLQTITQITTKLGGK